MRRQTFKNFPASPLKTETHPRTQMRFAEFLCPCFTSPPPSPPQHPRHPLGSNVLQRGDIDLDVNLLNLGLDLHETVPLVAPARVNMDGEMVHARVVEVDENESMIVVFHAGGELRRERCRLAGVTATITTTPTDPKTTTLAREWLRSRLQNNKVWVECGTWDERGCLFGTFYLNAQFNLSVNEEMVRDGFARAYDHDDESGAPPSKR